MTTTANIKIERKRFSITQGEVVVTWNNVVLGQFGDDIKLAESGEWEGKPDSYWFQIALNIAIERDLVA